MEIVKDNFCDMAVCALPAALEAVGERWSLLILRGAFNGLHHFEEFQSTLGIARNILANRLATLVKHGILSREPMAHDRRKVEYRLTEKGEALLPSVVALRQWGEKWASGSPSTPVLVDRLTHHPIRSIGIYSQDGRVLELPDLCWAHAEDVRPLVRLKIAQAA
ncbi:winged helix-turn-helix transcriptional regulator [Sphingomonas paeninsulae]|jgi:DNA-binding HxlR family transcriptional regulator